MGGEITSQSHHFTNGQTWWLLVAYKDLNHAHVCMFCWINRSSIGNVNFVGKYGNNDWKMGEATISQQPTSPHFYILFYVKIFFDANKLKLKDL